MQRGGFPFRTVILALFVVGTVYLLYLYNTTLGRLRDAELSAERYRREEETKVAQLQEVMQNKDELQERCDNDKREFTNRLNSLNQKHKMLKSQYDEHEVEQMRLEQEARRVKEEFQQVEAQRNQEYQQLKQEKDLEISSLKDQVANAHRQNEQLESQIASLRTQIQNGQNQVEYDQALLRSKESEITSLKQQLSSKNAELLQQQMLQQQQRQQPVMNGVNHFQQHQPQVPDVDSKLQQQQLPQQQVLQQQFQQQQMLQQQPQQHGLQQGVAGGQQGAVANMNIMHGADSNMAGQQVQDGLNAGLAQGGLNDLQHQLQQQPQLHELQHGKQQVEVDNEQHQVLPPNNAEQQGIPDAPVNRNVDGHAGQQEEVKNEDHQVRPPDFNADNADVGKGARGGVGADDKNSKHVEDNEHEDPLELKQMAAPKMDADAMDVVHGKGVAGQHGEEEEEEEDEDEDHLYEDEDRNVNIHNNQDAHNAAGDFR